jgi:hypothetical protein
MGQVNFFVVVFEHTVDKAIYVNTLIYFCSRGRLPR